MEPSASNIEIRASDVTLHGSLGLPDGAVGLVVFAHGSGSSRFSPRNRMVARTLREAGLGTLLFDLLTDDEERIDAVTRELRFDIAFLAERLVAVTRWLIEEQGITIPFGYFGASTGAAAALLAAAEGPSVRAVVSRGGRPDLAGDALERVRAPTLLIVGGNDFVVLDLNRAALERLHCEKKLVIVPGATHLFEERGALEQVAAEARDWYRTHFGAGG